MKLFSKLFLLFIIFLAPQKSKSQSNPVALKPGITINRILTVQDGSIRVIKDHISGNLFYSTTDGRIYEVHQPNGSAAYDSLVYTSADHHVTYAQGFTAHDSTFYISGNDSSSTPLTFGIIVRGVLQPNGTRVWSTLMQTDFYKTADYFDHLFSGIAVTPSGDSIVICSGARGDHGEIETRYGLYPGVRNEPLTTNLYIVPTHNPAIVILHNDTAWNDTAVNLYARGIRNTFDMAYDAQGRLFGVENSGDRDHNEEMNWLRRGHHYGFPWRMGDTDNPQQFASFNPATDLLIPHYSRSWRIGAWSNDPTYPPPPAGVTFDAPIQNFGPDADKYRDTLTGTVMDASDSGISIGTFTGHRSPLGLVFDNDSVMNPDYRGDAFMLSWTKGLDSCGCTATPDTAIGSFVDPSQDLIHLDLAYDSLIDNFTLHATRIVADFEHPVDDDIAGNKIYVLENGYGGTSGLYEIEMPVIATCSQTCTGGPPPANDSCFHATNFGVLPYPLACPAGNGLPATLAGTNMCATFETDHSPSIFCSGGNINPPLSDVWYTFDLDTNNGPILNLIINSATIHPAAVLYTGTDCGHMLQLGCAVSATNNLTHTFTGLSQGHYFLQVSSDVDTSECDFTITLSNDLNCSGCILQAGLIASPPPVNGSYPPNTTVNFCFTVSNYNQTAINWFHAVVPTFGAGWDPFSIVPVPAATCDTSGGYWEWVQNNVTSYSTGLVHGPGFYFETADGNIMGTIDNDPGNNYGDNNPLNLCDWTFCWSMTTRNDSAYCMDGTNLNISVDTYGDGESGAWTQYACDQDPIYYFFADESCCGSLATSISNSCTTGQSSATASTLGTPPYTFEWKDSIGTIIRTLITANGIDTIQNLFPGNYSVDVTDSGGCITTHTFTIAAPVNLLIDSVVPTTCIGCPDGSIFFSINLPSSQYALTWNPSLGSLAGNSIINLPAGTYTICAQDTMNCLSCDTVTVLEDPSLALSAILEKSISIFPNPSNGITTIRFTLLKSSSVSIHIYDAIGEEMELSADQKYFERGTNEISFDTKTLSSGFYFIELKTEDQKSERRFVVMKN